MKRLQGKRPPPLLPVMHTIEAPFPPDVAVDLVQLQRRVMMAPKPWTNLGEARNKKRKESRPEGEGEGEGESESESEKRELMSVGEYNAGRKLIAGSQPRSDSEDEDDQHQTRAIQASLIKPGSPPKLGPRIALPSFSSSLPEAVPFAGWSKQMQTQTQTQTQRERNSRNDQNQSGGLGKGKRKSPNSILGTLEAFSHSLEHSTLELAKEARRVNAGGNDSDHPTNTKAKSGEARSSRSLHTVTLQEPIREFYLQTFLREQDPLETLRRFGEEKLGRAVKLTQSQSQSQDFDDSHGQVQVQKQKPKQSGCNHYTVLYKESRHSFSVPPEGLVLTVGQFPGVDLRLGDVKSGEGEAQGEGRRSCISRVAFLICLLPECGEVAIVDPGSRHGFRMTARADKSKRLVSSSCLPSEYRCLAIAQWNEMLVLRHFTEELVLQPNFI